MARRASGGRPGMKTVTLRIDVTEAAGLGMELQTAITVYLPDTLAEPAPVVCFAFPGGGYNRHYYSVDMPGHAHGEAGYHCDRGWIFVSCDHLGAGDSSLPEDAHLLNYETLSRVNLATVTSVLNKLAEGEFGLPPFTPGLVLGIGQSMGGCLTIVLQAHHAAFDGIAVLGFSAIQTVVPSRPGSATQQWPWIARGSDLRQPPIINKAMLAAAQVTIQDQDDLAVDADSGEHPLAWAFHYDDVPAELAQADLGAALADGSLPPWRSPVIPACAIQMLCPGTVAAEAAVITAPVLVAAGEREVIPDPWLEPSAYRSSSDVSLFVCERMAHMHNFASTRERLWRRIHHWGSGLHGENAANRQTP